MRVLATVLGAIVGAAALSGTASAQIFVGSPALGTNSAGNIGLGVSFFDGGKGFGGGGTLGRTIYGSASFGYTDFDDTTLSLKRIAGALGYEYARDRSAVSICPSVGVGYGFGLEFLGIDFTTIDIVPAVAVGFATELTPTIVVVPFAEAGLVYSRLSADAGPLGEESESDTTGRLVIGVGFLINSRFSVGPSVAIPIAEDGGDTSFGVGLSVAVGRSTR